MITKNDNLKAMESGDHFKNGARPAKPSVQEKKLEIEEVDTIHHYKWGNKPVIYDDKHTTAFQYMNGKWSVISRHTFDDYADEIVDDNELQQFFPESIKKEYNKYITERYF
jgi:hypothetical protein